MDGAGFRGLDGAMGGAREQAFIHFIKSEDILTSSNNIGS
jgi:hypothetical protein